MQVEVKVLKKINIAKIRMTIPVRFEDEDIPYDFPLRSGKSWNITVNADTGEIEDFPKDLTVNVYLKVRDEGIYELIDDNGHVVAAISDYVPNNTIPGEYGDYIDFRIEGGIITNWLHNIDEEEFFPEDE
jgi:hypothetical protein